MSAAQPAAAQSQALVQDLGGTRIVAGGVLVVLIASLAFGGGTRSGMLGDSLLQVLALPLLVLVIATPAPQSLAGRGAGIFCLLLFAVPAAQLIPIGLTRVLPALANGGASVAVPATSISIAPATTLLAMLTLIPPIALFLAVRRLGWRERRLVSLVLLGGAIVSAFLGLAQLSYGPDSKLRFFTNTNINDAVGFFANRNHLAALLFTSSLLAAAWAVHCIAILRAASSKDRTDARVIVPVMASLAALVTLVATQAMARSRAGILLAMAALVGCYLIAATDRRRQQASGLSAQRLFAVAIGIGGLLAVQFALYRVMERFASDPIQDGRRVFARLTTEAARAFMPFGAGMGTFVDVYGLFETTADDPGGAYVNRAHNDLLEVWLEAGVVAGILLAVFAVWFGRRALAVWRRQAGGFDIDHALARAASLIVLLIGLHSLVDYPLRTSAMMAVTAIACALMSPAPWDDNLADAEFSRRSRRRRRAKPDVRSVPETTTIIAAGEARARRHPPPNQPAVHPAAPEHWPAAWRDHPDGKQPGTSDPAAAPPAPKSWRPE